MEGKAIHGKPCLDEPPPASLPFSIYAPLPTRFIPVLTAGGIGCPLEKLDPMIQPRSPHSQPFSLLRPCSGQAQFDFILPIPIGGALSQVPKILFGPWVLFLLRVKPRTKGSYLPHPHRVRPPEKTRCRLPSSPHPEPIGLSYTGLPPNQMLS